MLLTMAIIPLSLALRVHGEGAAAGSLDEITKVAGSVDISRWDYLNTQFRVIVTYIRLLFLPINQNLDYDYPIYKTFFTPPVYLSFLFLFSVFGWGVYLLYRSSLKLDSRLRGNDTKGKIKTFPEDSGNKNEEKYWYRLIAFGIFWFFVTISVESSVIPILDVIFEHRLYLPSVGFFMAIMASVMWFTGRWVNKPLIKKAVLTAMILAIAVFSATAYARNGVWRDEVTLWEDIMKRSPNKARPNYNLGLLYSKLNRIDEAIILYQTAIQITPNFYRPYNDLGNAYFNKGRLDDALHEYQTAVTLNPDYAEPYNNIGIVYAEKGRYEDAIREFQTALQLKPNYADAHANLGNAYYQQGHFREAIIQYQDALKLNPDHRAANNNLERLNKSGIVKKIKENP
jgi:tetratricopeptide (TPR) repeat protein